MGVEVRPLPGGYPGFQVTGMIEGFFLSLKFSIPGFGKFGKYVFGWLDLSRDFLGYSNNLKICGSAHVSRPCTSAWDFLGLIFGPGIFGGFVGSPREFFGF